MRLIDADAMKADLLTVDPQYETMIDWCICVLDAQPTIEPERKKGKWLPNPYSNAWDVCSVCGTGTKRREYGTNQNGTEWVTECSYLHCPWCGAEMEGQ